MNRYGHLAQEQWAEFMPSRYSELDDPDEFFRHLGETAQDQIAELSEQLEQQLTPTADYLQRVADLNAMWKQAEEIVLNDLIYSQVIPETDDDLEERLDQALSWLPSPDMIQDDIDRIWESAQHSLANDPRHEDQTEVLLTLDEQEEVARLAALMELIQVPENLPEPELVARIEKIEAEAQKAKIS